MRSALEQTVANAFRGKFSLDAVLSSLGNSFVQIQSQRIVESLFGNTLRSLAAGDRRGQGRGCRRPHGDGDG
jgi:hypothetical protein